MPNDENNIISDQNNVAGMTANQAQPGSTTDAPESSITTQPVTQGVSSSSNAPDKDKPKENVLLGTVGAVLGSTVGVVAIVLLDRLGFVAAFSGVVMAAGTILLYEKFANGLSIKGIIICIVVMVLMILLAENIAVSIAIMQELEKTYNIKLNFGDVFGNLYKWITDGIVDGGTYARSLVMVYLFNALGAFGIIKSSFDKKKSVNNRG